MPQPPARTLVDLARIRANALAIRAACGAGVDLIGVVKADAYGLGAVSVADALADLVAAWYVFRPVEAMVARLAEIAGKPTIAGCPDDDADDDLATLAAHAIRPAVWTPARARRYAALDPVLSVDTGMQRFACPADALGAMFDAHPFAEAMTHAARPPQARQLVEAVGSRVARLHAAGSALLPHAEAHLHAVRPGLALFEGAARVSAPLVEARDARGPVGYGAFESPTGRHGVLLRGYADGLRAGPCLVNGRRQRLLEVGMQSAYVSLAPGDRAGDEVVLLGDDLTLAEVAAAWGTSPQAALVTLAGLGERQYAA